MDHSLVNPNQLRQYGTKVQDNPVSYRALSIITENNDFCMKLAMAGTVVYADTFTPSDKEIHECPHIILSSTHIWDPHNVSFPKLRRTLEEEMGSHRYVSAVDSKGRTELDMFIENDDAVFSIDWMNRRISRLKTLDLGKPSFDPGKSDVPFTHAFQSSDRHTYVTAQDLSERWGISVPTVTKTLKKTTQKFLCSAALLLIRI